MSTATLDAATNNSTGDGIADQLDYENQYVSFWVDGQLLGVPVNAVQEVLNPQLIASTPKCQHWRSARPLRSAHRFTPGFSAADSHRAAHASAVGQAHRIRHRALLPGGGAWSTDRAEPHLRGTRRLSRRGQEAGRSDGHRLDADRA